MGLLNQFLQFIGLDHMVTSWLANVGTALAAVSVPEGWRFTGIYMVIFTRPWCLWIHPYEAAKVDGASEMQILFRIIAADQGYHPADDHVPDRRA
ncbi:MAG: hypothetical protein ACLVJO_01735 [[Clostridium] scindens]